MTPRRVLLAASPAKEVVLGHTAGSILTDVEQAVSAPDAQEHEARDRAG